MTTSYNYEFNLLGNNFGCTTSPSPISGTVPISPTDKITLLTANDNQIVCVNNTHSNICLYNNRIRTRWRCKFNWNYNILSRRSPCTVWITSGFGYNLTASNTIRIQGAADPAANLASSTTIYEYRIETSPGTCETAIATGTIEVRTAPTLALVSTPTTSSQIICDDTDMETIIYEFGGGARG